MRSFYPIVFAIVFILSVGIVEILLLRLLNKVWWKRPLIRRCAIALPLVGSIMVLAWGLGEYHTISWLAYIGAVLAVIAFMSEVALMLSLPISGVIHLLHTFKTHLAKKRKRGGELDQNRRDFLKATAAAVPLITIAGSVSGVTRSFGDVNVYKREMLIEGLPSDFEGLKILQISDPHLRHYVTLDDLEQVCTDAAAFEPDLTLVSGDVADDLKQLLPALKMIHDLKSPLGTYACLGNHEYYRGIEEVYRIYEKAPVPLLVDDAVSITVKNSRLTLGSTNDPVGFGSRHQEFYRDSIERILTKKNLGDLTVLMAHRPDALDVAAENGINLVLSGHTHGGQIGIGGRSVFESVWPDRYLWGEYSRGKTKLYTSCGVGHWFPFRLGCQREAPVFELHRA
ncbi:MAG TPA: metallophosphoesterase [candidate division Zixibacteria bacterium]|nr:metallophosphoesterase [candidate division Zixibacteria bacterium]